MIERQGKTARVLSGSEARKFMARIVEASKQDAERLMARATGQCKFGNEREARPDNC